MEKYSRGRRGAPAKGVGRATGARVQIPLSPLAQEENREVLFFVARKWKQAPTEWVFASKRAYTSKT